MLTGRFPFNGANVHELIRAHLLETPPPLSKYRPGAPPELENLINRMLAKTPHYRPARASEAAATFEQAVRNLPDFSHSSELVTSELGHASNGQPKSGTNTFTPVPGWSHSGQHSPTSGLSGSFPTPTTPTTISGEFKHLNQTPTSFHTSMPTGMPSPTSSLGGYTTTSVSVNPSTPHTLPNLQATPVNPFSQSGTMPVVATERNRKLLWGALAAVVLFVASAGYYFFNRTPKLTERDTILLADFVNATGDDVFDRTLKQALSVQLSQSPFLNLLAEEKIRETLRFMNRKGDERLTREVAREISLRQGLKAMILGQIDKLDRHYSITLEAVNSQTGEALTRTLAEADGKDQVLRALGQAATELRGALGESLGSIQKFNAPVDQATTSSLEALKAYSLGRDQYSLRDNYTEGLALYKRAIELDPNFALAYNGLGIVYMNIGQAELSVENAEKAYKLRDRVSERERLAITSFYYLINGEVEKAIEIYRLTVQTYPRQVSPHVNLSVAFNRLGQLEAAYSEVQEAIKLDPTNATAYQNGAGLLVRLGRYDEAIQLINKAQSQKLDRLGYHEMLYQIGLVKGDHMLMHKQVEWTKGKTDEFRGYEWQAQTAGFSGKLRAADDFIRRALELTKQRNLNEVSAALMMNHALRLALAGKSSNAQALLDEAVKLSPNSFALYSVSKSAPFGPLMLALSGDTKRAKEFDEEMVKRQPRNTLANTIWLPLARAASELRNQRPAKALELLHPVSHYESGAFFYPAWLRGQAYLQLEQGREAAAEFEKILAHRGYEPSSLLYPLAQLELGRAHALIGDKTKAREHYNKFLMLWKEADSDLPVLNAAKKEYAKLK
jgi:tetratricopeptide (TPR) repeat protein